MVLNLIITEEEVMRIIDDICEHFNIPKPNISFDERFIPENAYACYIPDNNTIYVRIGDVTPNDIAHEMGHAIHTYYNVKLTRAEAEAFARAIEKWYVKTHYGGEDIGDVIYRRRYVQPQPRKVKNIRLKKYYREMYTQLMEIPLYVTSIKTVKYAYEGEKFYEDNPVLTFKANVKGDYEYEVRLIDVKTGNMTTHSWYQDYDGTVEFSEPYLSDMRMPNETWNLKLEIYAYPGGDRYFGTKVYEYSFSVKLSPPFTVKVPFPNTTVIAIPRDIALLAEGLKYTDTSNDYGEAYIKPDIRGKYFIYAYRGDWFGYVMEADVEPNKSIKIPMKLYKEPPTFHFDLIFSNPISADLFNMFYSTIMDVFAKFAYDAEVTKIWKPKSNVIRYEFTLLRGSPFNWAILANLFSGTAGQILAIIIALGILITLVGWMFGPKEVVGTVKLIAVAAILGAVAGIVAAVRGK